MRSRDNGRDNGRQFDGRDGIRDSASSFLEEGRRRTSTMRRECLATHAIQIVHRSVPCVICAAADNFGSSGGGGLAGASNDRFLDSESSFFGEGKSRSSPGPGKDSSFAHRWYGSSKKAYHSCMRPHTFVGGVWWYQPQIA